MVEHPTSRACVFIDSSNPSMPCQLINSSAPLIRPPFPPLINPHDLISYTSASKNDLNQKKIPTRAPNAFIIYRKVFIETARSQGYYLPMTVISSMASQSWEHENDIVKSEYKRLAREAFNIRCELLPKTLGASRRRKREKWNIISFEDNNSNDSDINDVSNINNNSSNSSNSSNSNSNSNGHVYSKKKGFPGLLNWNSRSNVEQVSYPSPVFSSNISSPETEINNINSSKEPIIRTPPLFSPSSENHAEHAETSPPKPQIFSSKIRLLLNLDDE